MKKNNNHTGTITEAQDICTRYFVGKDLSVELNTTLDLVEFTAWKMNKFGGEDALLVWEQALLTRLEIVRGGNQDDEGRTTRLLDS